MVPTGTPLARHSRMNDRPLVPASSLLSPLRLAEPPAPADEEQRGDDGGEVELDKYDISTLACTD